MKDTSSVASPGGICLRIHLGEITRETYCNGMGVVQMLATYQVRGVRPLHSDKSNQVFCSFLLCPRPHIDTTCHALEFILIGHVDFKRVSMAGQVLLFLLESGRKARAK